MNLRGPRGAVLRKNHGLPEKVYKLRTYRALWYSIRSPFFVDGSMHGAPASNLQECDHMFTTLFSTLQATVSFKLHTGTESIASADARNAHEKVGCQNADRHDTMQGGAIQPQSKIVLHLHADKIILVPLQRKTDIRLSSPNVGYICRSQL